MRSLSISTSLVSALLSFAAVSCGGGNQAPANSPDGTADGGASASGDVPAGEVAQAEKKCGAADTVQKHDIHKDGATEAFVPCSKDGKGDYSGIVKIETLPDGVHITIQATDDEVDSGVLGGDVKTRDAVIVYPKGHGQGAKAIEVPLVKNATGYTGDKIVLWDDLDKLNGDGTQLDIAVFDHDKSSNKPSEELHIQVAVSTGKSCEKAIDENPQTLDMGKKGAPPRPDLTDAQLGAPMKTSGFFSHCGLADKENAEICVAVKNGKPVGVSVVVTPTNKRTAACIDRATRKLHFPASDKLDVVHQKF
jgi:hypothetical protein